MKRAVVKVHNSRAGILQENDDRSFRFTYDSTYDNQAISLTMPVNNSVYEYDSFPPFFDGLLPEGIQLEGLLKTYKIDRTDYFSQLFITGEHLIGAATITELHEDE